MMNVLCMAHAAKPARTPTGHTDAAAQKDTSYSLTGYHAKPNKVSSTLASGNNIIYIVRFISNNKQGSFVQPEWDSAHHRHGAHQSW